MSSSRKNSTNLGRISKRNIAGGSDVSASEYDSEDQAVFDKANSMRVDELRQQLLEMGFTGNIQKMVKTQLAQEFVKLVAQVSKILIIQVT